MLGNRRRRSLATAITAVLTVGGLLTLAPAAQAAVPGSPTGLGPDGTTVNNIPVLSWDRQDDASTYDVQVSASNAFSSLLWNQLNSWNDKATPNVQLPLGTIFWRVRAHNSSGYSDWTVGSFDHTAVSPPTPIAPADDASIHPPGDTMVFQWSPVDGATGYVVRIGQDADFTDPTRYTVLSSVQARAAVLNGLLAPNTYYWQVQAKLGSGYSTDWSQAQSLKILGLDQPTRQGPPDDINNAVQDVVLDWDPVAGAVTYDLQVSTDSNFNTTVANVTKITGTRYSPTTTLNNDQYYWRVRAVDAGGFKNDWSVAPIWHFKRNWPDQPHLTYPADGASVGDPFYYQWTPVPHASRYVVQLSTDPNFTSTTVPQNPISCVTRHTTFTPVDPDDTSTRPCMPTAYGTYYWKVYAVDDPRSPDLVKTDFVNGAAEVHSFTYAPDLVTETSPANGSSTSLPTMSWQPLAGAAKYKVSWTDITANTNTSVVTSTTSYTPRNELKEGHTYRWQVQSISIDGALGAGLTTGSQPTFTVLAQPAGVVSTPDPTSTNTTTARFPTLTWSQVTGATTYRLYVRKSGTTAWSQIGGGGTTFDYPAGQDLGDSFSAPGVGNASQQYDWQVEAYSGSTLLGTGAIGHYTIQQPAPVTGFAAALTGNDLTGAAGETIDKCGATLPSECQNLRQTPVLKWDPNPDTGFYRVYLTFDGANNGVSGLFPVDVDSTMWIDPKTLPDSQAGSAYYWTVVPCTSPNVCAALDHASHAFNKQSNQVVLNSPVSADPNNPTLVADDVTFTWQDYLATEAAADTSTTALSSPAETEAQQYRVQVSTAPDFSTTLDNKLVDQTTFTSFDNTYPEGVLYWRVAAVDGSGNALNWSTPAVFEKRSPIPTLTYPVSNPAVPEVNGTNAFTWNPLPFAKSYDLEVYKNDDLVGQTANRVINANSLVAAYAPSTLLPASTTPYTWRVRRVDAMGRKGAWTPFQEFLSAGDSPTLTSPVNNSAQAPNDILFTWLPTANAAKYKFERKLAGSSTVAESITTANVAWAEPNLVGSGTWQWRVTALDANGNALGAPGNWTDMQFTVDSGLSPANDVSIAGSGAVGTLLTLQAPTWNLPGVTTTYKWQRNGLTISGQTGESYTVANADVGKNITVVATGVKAGYTNGTSTSNAIAATAGPAPTPSVEPSITGTAVVGQVLTADHGVWPGTPKYTYQWLRNGTAISGATGSTYRLQLPDAAQQISVRVTATVTGLLPGQATSGAVTVAKLTSSTKVALATGSIKKGTHGTLNITVSVSGVTAPTGRLKVFDGRKRLTTVTLTAAGKGHKSVRLPLLAVGRHKLHVTYTGNTTIKSSKSGTVTLTVTR